METAKSEEDCWSLLTQWPLIVPTITPMNNCNDCYWQSVQGFKRINAT
jgi:hypothetical protein